jgi:hypothetical protein
MYRTAGSRYQDLQSALDTSQVCAAVGSSLHAAIGNLDIKQLVCERQTSRSVGLHEECVGARRLFFRCGATRGTCTPPKANWRKSSYCHRIKSHEFFQLVMRRPGGPTKFRLGYVNRDFFSFELPSRK